MGRLEKSAPTVSLTDAQKLAISEVDSEINAKIAEKKIFLEGQMVTGNPGGKGGDPPPACLRTRPPRGKARTGEGKNPAQATGLPPLPRGSQDRNFPDSSFRMRGRP